MSNRTTLVDFDNYWDVKSTLENMVDDRKVCSGNFLHVKEHLDTFLTQNSDSWYNGVLNKHFPTCYLKERQTYSNITKVFQDKLEQLSLQLFNKRLKRKTIRSLDIGDEIDYDKYQFDPAYCWEEKRKVSKNTPFVRLAIDFGVPWHVTQEQLAIRNEAMVVLVEILQQLNYKLSIDAIAISSSCGTVNGGSCNNGYDQNLVFRVPLHRPNQTLDIGSFQATVINPGFFRSSLIAALTFLPESVVIQGGLGHSQNIDSAPEDIQEYYKNDYDFYGPTGATTINNSLEWIDNMLRNLGIAN